jgi:ABC-2 type transport system permease protein
MQVFKLCMKIIRKNKGTMLIYVFVFLAIAILISYVAEQKPIPTAYSATKADVAFFLEENTPIVSGLKEELSKTANFVDIEDNEEKIQDALYYRKVTYVVRIPKGFTEKIMNGEKAVIERTTVPDSVYGTYIDMKINRYLNMAQLYVQSNIGITQEKLVSNLQNDLSKSVDVTMTSSQKNVDAENKPFTSYYFNYLAYVLPAVLIFGIAVLMQTVNGNELRRRTFCSPMTPKAFYSQLLLAIAGFSVICWIILILPCIVIDPKHFFVSSTYYMILNSFAFLLVSIGISYLIGSLVRGMNSISALANVCTLGPCFIAGVFVSQTYLSSPVLKLASFTPTYWFVKANDAMGTATHISGELLSGYYVDIVIELAFAAAFFAVGLAAGKKKRMEA